VLILALDTTTRAGSLAIVRDGSLILETAGDPTLTHGQRLPTDIVRACTHAGVTVRDIDLFAVAAGPGSFTGLRVGIATIQGLAFSLQKHVVPVSSLEAIAYGARLGGARVAAWMDAQRHEVFAELSGEIEASSGSPEDILANWLSHTDLRGIEFHGDGAVRYAARIQKVLGNYVRVASEVPPLAGAIGLIAAREPERAVSPHAVVPLYVRRPDAELARERRTRST
jgi:tRNA threonylcarbamoyladenosine biosynthesis protein TsaB